MSDFLKEILLNKEIPHDDMLNNHKQDGRIVFNVPCRKIEGLGIVYKSTTMSNLLSILEYMKENDLDKIDYSNCYFNYLYKIQGKIE